MKGPRLLAEAIGTFLLVFVGPGAAATDAFTRGGLGPVGVALAFAFVLVAAVYAFGHISGAHFNPVVSIAFWLSGRFPRAEVLPYVGAQIVGASAAGMMLQWMLGPAAAAAATIPRIPALPAMATEMVLSCFLMLVVLAVATDARVSSAVGGLAVGLTVGAAALMAGPLTGASLNPARSFGPALASGIWRGHWIYWIGPLAGAGLAVPVYAFLRSGSKHDYYSAA